MIMGDILGNYEVELEFRGKYGTFEYKTELSVGADLSAQGIYVIHPGETCRIDTGVFIKSVKRCELVIPYFANLMTEFQIRPKSGLSVNGIKSDLGTIDLDYKDEFGVILYNTSKDTFIVSPGDRVAQLVPALVFNLNSIPRKQVERTGGFGSTGIR